MHDEAYLAFVRELPCCVRDGRCFGRIDPHQAGQNPYGRKANDDTCIPLCRRHHDEWDAPDWSSNQGPFAGWTKAQRREWQDARIYETRLAWNWRNEAGRNVAVDIPW